jgi:hypothetical protein
MKKLICFLMIMSLFISLTYSQVPKGDTLKPKITTGKLALHHVDKKVFNIGAINDNGIIATFNSTKKDTLYSADTLFFIVQVNHASAGYPYLTVNTKVGTTDTTLNTTATATFWQSVDGLTNWSQIKSVSSTGTILYDTTLVFGRGANNISSFDTTLVFGRGANNIASFDTTLVFGRGANGKMLVTDTTVYAKGFTKTAAGLLTVFRNRALYAQTMKNRALYAQTMKNRALYSGLETISKAEAVYSVTIPRSYNAGAATPNNEVSFWRNNLKFESQYLGIRFISGTKTGSKLVYTGTVRFNKAN